MASPSPTKAAADALIAIGSPPVTNVTDDVDGEGGGGGGSGGAQIEYRDEEKVAILQELIVQMKGKQNEKARTDASICSAVAKALNEGEKIPSRHVSLTPAT